MAGVELSRGCIGRTRLCAGGRLVANYRWYRLRLGVWADHWAWGLPARKICMGILGAIEWLVIRTRADYPASIYSGPNLRPGYPGHRQPGLHGGDRERMFWL